MNLYKEFFLVCQSYFFAQWVIDYGFAVFNVESPKVEFSWFALAVGGLAWGLAYVIVGTANAGEEVVDCLFPLFDTYYNLFDPFDFGEFVRGLLSALPINFLISWGAAIGLGILAATQFGASLSGVVHLVFGSLVFIGIANFLVDT